MAKFVFDRLSVEVKTYFNPLECEVLENYARKNELFDGTKEGFEKWIMSVSAADVSYIMHKAGF